MSAGNSVTENNFDLIRLLAASQVVLSHAFQHLEVAGNSALVSFSNLFPGVPVFFFTSGFLISKSFERNSVVAQYTLNRLLRIYPALIVCLVLSALSVLVVGYMSFADIPVQHGVFWLFAQATFFQFYNPEFLRGYGVGVLNGSLWTISVELQFYVLIPLMYKIFKLKGNIRGNAVLIATIVVFLILNRVFVYGEDEYGEEIIYKLIGVSFFPWFYMFLVGVFVQRNQGVFEAWLGEKALWLLPGYVVLALVLRELDIALGNSISPLIYIPLIIALFSFAFSFRSLSTRLLQKNDISYGVYIYHMPVINALIYLGYAGTWQVVILAFLLTFMLATTSWVLVEKPFLKRKVRPLNDLNAASSKSI